MTDEEHETLLKDVAMQSCWQRNEACLAAKKAKAKRAKLRTISPNYGIFLSQIKDTMLQLTGYSLI